MIRAHNDDYPSFSIDEKQKGLFELLIQSDNANPVSFDLEYFTFVLQNSLDVLTRPESVGLILRFTGTFRPVDWMELFGKSKAKNKFAQELSQVINLILSLQENNKIIVGIFDDACLSYAFNCLLLCDYKIAVGKNTRVGFPETEFGLFPGFGSTIILHQMIGAQESLELLSKGKIYTIQKALRVGIINNHVDQLPQARLAAEKMIRTGVKKHTLLNSQASPTEPGIIHAIQNKINTLNPAIDFYYLIFKHIDNKPLKELLSLEKTAITAVLESKAVKAVLRSLFYGVQDAKRIISTMPQSNFSPKKIAIIGAGMMGSGIAYVAGMAGMEVDLKDAKPELTKKGMETVTQVAQKAVQLQKMTDHAMEDLLHRINPLDHWDKLKSYDLIIEAVFEDKDLKTRVTLESIPFLLPDGLMASNTTSLPISSLAQHMPDPSKFIGLHFFSPVERMPLVEVIVGKQTSEETLHKALQFVDQVGKIPIQVNDGPAFFTSRIFFNFLLEGITMLLEGIPADYIEKSAKKAGYAVGPLAVLDEISLPLMIHVYNQLPKLSTSQRKACAYLEKLVQYDRQGRKSGQGFYTYKKEEPKQLWIDPELQLMKELPEEKSMMNRLLFVVALDAYRCLQDGILGQPTDGDIGSILGIGFPKFTGGVFSFIDLIGIKNFVKRCIEYQEFGDQWHVPDSLKELANRNFEFYTDFRSNWKENKKKP